MLIDDFAVHSVRPVARHAALRPLAWLRQASAVRHERRALGRLDSRRLTDLGLRSAAAWSESNRPFWELPDCRRW